MANVIRIDTTELLTNFMEFTGQAKDEQVIIDFFTKYYPKIEEPDDIWNMAVIDKDYGKIE